MEPGVYEEMAKIEEKHWWYVGRRRIIDRVLSRLPIAKDAKVLEIGCGTGGNLEMLGRYGTLYAADFDAEARRIAAERGVTARIEPCELPGRFPFAGESFDLVLMLDVLEHIDDDIATLKAVRDHMRGDGWLVLTVPAFQSLWSAHDESAHHKRRYTRALLASRVREAGFKPIHQSYFNFWLFPPVALVRLIKNTLFGKGGEAPSDMGLPPKPINGLLAWLFGTERFLVGRTRLPFGVSCIMSAQPAVSAV